MPNVSPRIAITPTPELKAALEELADAMEQPVSRIIVSLLTEMAPQLRDLAKVARHTKAGKTAAAKRALQHMVGNALAEQLSFIKEGKK